jgi:hypothetical protein
VRVNGGGAINVGTATQYSDTFAAGDYSLEVRAVNKSGAGPWSAASPNGHIENAKTIVLSAGAAAPGNGYWYHIKVSGFSGDIQVRCMSTSSSGVKDTPVTGTWYTVPNGFNGDLSCYSGYGGYWVDGPGNDDSNYISQW